MDQSQEVGVAAIHLRGDVDEDDLRTGRNQTSRAELDSRNLVVRTRTGTTPQYSVRRLAVDGSVVAARIGTVGRSADRSCAVCPFCVIATMACALPRLLSVIAASQSARACPAVALSSIG